MRHAQVAYSKLVTKPVFVDTNHDKVNTPYPAASTTCYCHFLSFKCLREMSVVITVNKSKSIDTLTCKL